MLNFAKKKICYLSPNNLADQLKAVQSFFFFLLNVGATIFFFGSFRDGVKTLKI